MPINYSIDAEARIVRLSYVGDATIEEYVAAMTAIIRHADYRPGFGFLSDRRNAKAPTTSYVEGTVLFAKDHRESLIGARWATVVSSPVNYGLARMAQTILENRGGFVVLKIFREIDEAELWLRQTDRGALDGEPPASR